MTTLSLTSEVMTAATSVIPGEPEDACNISHTLGYVAIGVVFVLSISGAYFPVVVQFLRPKWDVLHHPFFRFCQGLAGGFVICVGLVHCFPDGVEDLSSEEADLPDYAWGGLFALIGLLATWTCEAAVLVYLRTTPIPTDAKDFEGEACSRDISELHCDHALEKVMTREIRLQNYTALIILLSGLTFHSVFVGFAIGLDNDTGLFIAILAHQFFEATAIGFHLLRSNVNAWIGLLMVGIFSISAPFGTGIGIAISVSICGSGAFAIVAGIFNSLAAGILIYVGCIHMVVGEFTKEDVLSDRFMAFILWLGVVVGMAAMAVIGIWA